MSLVSACEGMWQFMAIWLHTNEKKTQNMLTNTHVLLMDVWKANSHVSIHWLMLSDFSGELVVVWKTAISTFKHVVNLLKHNLVSQVMRNVLVIVHGFFFRTASNSQHCSSVWPSKGSLQAQAISQNSTSGKAQFSFSNLYLLILYRVLLLNSTQLTS